MEPKVAFVCDTCELIQLEQHFVEGTVTRKKCDNCGGTKIIVMVGVFCSNWASEENAKEKIKGW